MPYHKKQSSKELGAVFLELPLIFSTFLGVASAILYFTAIVGGGYGPALIALCGMGLNLLDRHYNRENARYSNFFKVLNSTSDRMADIFLVGAFGFADIVNWPLIFIYISLSYMNSYIRSRTETLTQKHAHMNIGPMKRYVRVGLVTLTTVFLYMGFETFSGIYVADLMFVLMAFLSAVTLLIRLYRSYNLLKPHHFFLRD